MYTGSVIRLGVTPLPNARYPIFLCPSSLQTTFFLGVFTSSIAGLLDPSTFDHLHRLVTDYLVIMHGPFRAIFVPRLGRTGWCTELPALIGTPDMTTIIIPLSTGRLSASHLLLLQPRYSQFSISFCFCSVSAFSALALVPLRSNSWSSSAHSTGDLKLMVLFHRQSHWPCLPSFGGVVVLTAS